MPFPDIDPIAFQIGPLAIRWYGLAYAVGIILGMLLARHYAQRWREFGIPKGAIEDFAFWVIVGILLGGRLGYILLYHPGYYLENPLSVFDLQRGGMSFHGGFIGVALGAVWFSRRRLGTLLSLTDVVACVVPIGLFLGRLANFINGELWGRATALSWGVVFPTGGPLPRHPSQLYEAALEGVLLFVILNILIRFRSVRSRKGMLTGVFVAGYGIIRFLVEFVREPDAELIAGITRGQFYSLPMIIAGVVLVLIALRRENPPLFDQAAAGKAPVGEQPSPLPPPA